MVPVIHKNEKKAKQDMQTKAVKAVHSYSTLLTLHPWRKHWKYTTPAEAGGFCEMVEAEELMEISYFFESSMIFKQKPTCFSQPCSSELSEESSV